MNKLFLLPLVLLAGCSDLPSINPLPTITATVTVTATPETTKAIAEPTSTTEAVANAAKQQNQIAKSASSAPIPLSSPPTKPSKDFYEIRYEGKAGTKATGTYSIHALRESGLGQIEEKKGILPFTVKLELPPESAVGASFSSFEEGVNPKVFINRNGKECGKVLFSGSAIPNPEASKACMPEQ